MKKLKVLMSAYACEPGKGSEPEVGWHTALEMAKYHEVWVITRSNNRPSIEAELADKPVPNLHFVYYDLPDWVRFWKRRGRGIQLYYYLWQLGIYPVVKRLHRQVGFEVAHHVSFVRYWTPSFVAFLPVPFLWGPVGGGESTPGPFLQDFSLQGRVYERLRSLARWLGEQDPFVKLTAKRCELALAATPATAARLEKINVPACEVLSQLGMSTRTLKTLSQYPAKVGDSLRFMSMGNLLHWKGFHLGLRAFAAADLPDAEYWLVGDGPERERLQALVKELGIEERVHFWRRLPREQALEKLTLCDALVHPSLHDSGGFVCLEAMAACKPVVCLDLGGPALQVTPEVGFKVPAHHPEQVVSEMADIMVHLAKLRDTDSYHRLGRAGRQRVSQTFSWEQKGRALNQIYARIAGTRYEHP